MTAFVLWAVLVAQHSPIAIHMTNKSSHGKPVLTCYSVDGEWNKATNCRIEPGHDLDEVVKSFISIMDLDCDCEINR